MVILNVVIVVKINVVIVHAGNIKCAGVSNIIKIHLVCVCMQLVGSQILKWQFLLWYVCLQCTSNRHFLLKFLELPLFKG